MLLADSPAKPDTWAVFRALIDGVTMIWAPLALMAVFAGLIAAARLCLLLLERRRLARSGLSDIDRMGGRTFEQYLEVIFARLGYRVVRTRFAGDYGGDLVLAKDGTRTVVQAKRWTKAVGVRAVQEAVAAKGQYDCSEAMVVTNSHYTKQAVHLARVNRVVLWDRNELATRLLRTHAKDGSPTVNVASPDFASVEKAPRRGIATSETLATVETCDVCAKLLTPGERAYCEGHSERFAGKMLCFRHQRGIRQRL